MRFPDHQEEKTQKVTAKINETKGRKVFAKILFTIYGYLSMALMIWYTHWITLFGKNTHGFNNLQSYFLLSLYSIGSIVGVLLLFALLGKNVSEIGIMIAMNVVATL